MVFNQNLVAVVKSDGKILREIGDCVYIPFGKEYKILIKNLFTRKAMVNVEIDGKCAIENLVIDSNSEIELERFFENDLSKGHKFKFIEKTDDIKDFRGDKIDDGIIRITYQFEKRPLDYSIEYWTYPVYKIYHDDMYFDNSIEYRTYPEHRTYDNNSLISDYSEQNSTVCNEEGITVNGDYSEQNFKYVSEINLEDTKHCITFQLKGMSKENKINKPITTKTKFYCDVCGKSNKSKNKFCSKCGNCLI